VGLLATSQHCQRQQLLRVPASGKGPAPPRVAWPSPPTLDECASICGAHWAQFSAGLFSPTPRAPRRRADLPPLPPLSPCHTTPPDASSLRYPTWRSSARPPGASELSGNVGASLGRGGFSSARAAQQPKPAVLHCPPRLRSSCCLLSYSTRRRKLTLVLLSTSREIDSDDRRQSAKGETRDRDPQRRTTGGSATPLTPRRATDELPTPDVPLRPCK